MTEQEAKIKDLELRVKKLEDKVFDVWLGQYEPKVNWTQEAQDEWFKNSNNNPDVFAVCKPHNDEYIGGPVAGYCPDYMKVDK